MSNIYDLLAQIENAVYGKDVRDAIHDSIEQCYKDATGNPDSLADIFEKLFNGSIAGIGDIVEGVNDYADTVNVDLNTSRVINAIHLKPGTWIILSNALFIPNEEETKDGFHCFVNIMRTDGDYVRILDESRSVIFVKSGARVSASGCVIVNIDSADSTLIEDSDPDINGTKLFTLCMIQEGSLTGSAKSSFTAIKIKSDSDGDETSLAEQVAQNTAELIDIRTGDDGVTYADAGTAVRTQFADVKQDLNDLQEEIEGGGSGFTDDQKEALLACFRHVGFLGAEGENCYNALVDALYNTTWQITNMLSHCTTSNAKQSVTKGGSYSAIITPSDGYKLDGATVSITMGGIDITSTAYNNGTISIASVTGALIITITAVEVEVESISAEYTQSGTVYTTDSLEALKDDLVVTATYEDQTSAVVTDYTLSGTLTEGTSTITVGFGGKTDTFTVTVTAPAFYPYVIDPSTEPGVGAGAVGAKAYPYNTNTNSNRLHFSGENWLGYPVELGKSYTIDAVLAEGVSKTYQIGVFTINETGKAIIEEQGTLASSNLSDSGWKNLPYTFTASQVSSVDPALIWINSHWTDNSAVSRTDIVSITITENE